MRLHVIRIRFDPILFTASGVGAGDVWSVVAVGRRAGCALVGRPTLLTACLGGASAKQPDGGGDADGGEQCASPCDMLGRAVDLGSFLQFPTRRWYKGNY